MPILRNAAGFDPKAKIVDGVRNSQVAQRSYYLAPDVFPAPESGPLDKDARNLAIAGIAHDLGNHLQILTSAMSIIERQLPGACPEVLFALRGATGAISRASMLSRMLRDNGGEGALVMKEVTQLAGMLCSLSDLVALIAGNAIKVEILPTTDAYVLCDPRGLEQCLLNLTSNGCNAMPSGGLLVIEAYRELSQDKSILDISHAVLCVTDTGCGMTPETIESAFVPYFTTRSDGTGLGLANVREFVCQAGGSIDISSQIGVGTCVTIRMPEWIRDDHVKI